MIPTSCQPQTSVSRSRSNCVNTLIEGIGVIVDDDDDDNNNHNSNHNNDNNDNNNNNNNNNNNKEDKTKPKLCKGL